MAHERKDISLVTAYTIGVADEMISSNYAECGELLEKLKEDVIASTMRSLCMLRTSLMKNYRRTDEEYRRNVTSSDSLKSMSWFDQSCIDYLKEQGVDLRIPNARADDLYALLNKTIYELVDKCRNLYPSWVNWSYVRDLYVIPKYHIKKYAIAEYEKFVNYLSMYPFSCYIHWEPFECSGLIKNDRIFLQNLYNMRGDTFTDKSKYTEVDEGVSANIYSFIHDSDGVVIAVDCENANMYKFYSFLDSLNEEDLKLIKKILLYDDANTLQVWKLLSGRVNIPVEYMLVERVLNRKSLVDIRMTVGICNSHYNDRVNSFIIVSSDSDYCGVISSLPTAKFMVVYENKKSSSTVIDELMNKDVFACCLDDFYTGNASELKNYVLQCKLNDELAKMSFELDVLLEKAMSSTNMEMSKEEKEAFRKKCLKGIKGTISKEGVFSVVLK